jgi:hypothetical protein
MLLLCVSTGREKASGDVNEGLQGQELLVWKRVVAARVVDYRSWNRNECGGG